MPCRIRAVGRAAMRNPAVSLLEYARGMALSAQTGAGQAQPRRQSARAVRMAFAMLSPRDSLINIPRPDSIKLLTFGQPIRTFGRPSYLLEHRVKRRGFLHRWCALRYRSDFHGECAAAQLNMHFVSDFHHVSGFGDAVVNEHAALLAGQLSDRSSLDQS